MFDLIFQGAQAYNQVGFFIGAVVCLGIGGLILGNSLYWRVHALRAQGTVIGVIANGGAYIPVYPTHRRTGKAMSRSQIWAPAGCAARKPGALSR